MFLHVPAVRAAFPTLHVGLLLLRRAHRLDFSACAVAAQGGLPACGSPHPVALLCAALAAETDVNAAVFDLDRIEGTLCVQLATGRERFEDISGAVTHPQPGTVIFADAAERVHACDWAARRSPYSALSDDSRTAFVVAQALHPGAAADVRRMLDRLADALCGAGGAVDMLDLGFANGLARA